MVAINELGGSAPRLYTSRPLIRLCQPVIAIRNVYATVTAAVREIGGSGWCNETL